MPKLNASTLNALLTPQFIVYLTGGVLSAAIDIGVMQWLLHLDATLVTATSVGFFAGMVVNFAFHARVVRAEGPPADFDRSGASPSPARALARANGIQLEFRTTKEDTFR